MATYKRILLKLSGESLMGEKQYGIDEKRLAEYAAQIKGDKSENLPGRTAKFFKLTINFSNNELR